MTAVGAEGPIIIEMVPLYSEVVFLSSEIFILFSTVLLLYLLYLLALLLFSGVFGTIFGFYYFVAWDMMGENIAVVIILLGEAVSPV